MSNQRVEIICFSVADGASQNNILYTLIIFLFLA